MARKCLAATAVALLVALAAYLVLRDRSGEDFPAVAPPAQTPSDPDPLRPRMPSTEGSPSSLAIVSLGPKYEACAIAAGFDPGGVQVVVGGEGTPQWVKTGRDVPAEIHRPCLIAIGGADPQRSSHGTPAQLLACMGPEVPGNTPPPPPSEVAADAVVGADLATAQTAAGGRVGVVWTVPDATELRVPTDTIIQCWTGQQWQSAYGVQGFADGLGVSAELSDDLVLTDELRAIDDTMATIPVPDLAPRGFYRIFVTVTACDAAGDCRPAEIEARFQVV